MDYLLIIDGAWALIALLMLLFNYSRTKSRLYLNFVPALVFVLASFGVFLGLNLTHDSNNPFDPSGDLIFSSNSTGSTGFAQAFNSDQKLASSVALLVVASSLSRVAELLFELATLQLFIAWLNSLQGVVALRKYQHSISTAQNLRYYYVAVSLAMLVLLPLYMYVNINIVFGYLGAIILYCAGNGAGLGALCWAYWDIHRTPHLTKRKQAVVIFLLMFFASDFFSTTHYGWNATVFVAWWMRCIFLVWPGSPLAEFGKVPSKEAVVVTGPDGASTPENPPAYVV